MRLIDFSVHCKGRTVIDGANAVFPRDGISHVVGRNGEGKSTLAKAMGGLLPFEGGIEDSGGSISVIGSYSCIPSDLRVGMLISLIKRRFAGKETSYLLSHLGIGDMPAGCRIANLSDGQRQKLKLLFFLSSCPDVVVLDEFTGSLDATSADEMRSFLLSYSAAAGKTIINITHDMVDLQKMPGCYFLLEGGSLTRFPDRENLVRRYIGEVI